MENYHFPVFRGLQRPLEFMGIKGRFLILFAVAIGGSFIVFLIASLIATKLVGFIAMVVFAGISVITIFIKQKQGLHSKKREKSIFIYKSIYIDKLS